MNKAFTLACLAAVATSTKISSLGQTPADMQGLSILAQASADAELAVIQREAYLDFRANVTALVAGEFGPCDEAEREAERLIALVDGIALQALFAPDLWTEERQLAALDVGMGIR